MHSCSSSKAKCVIIDATGRTRIGRTPARSRSVSSQEDSSKSSCVTMEVIDSEVKKECGEHHDQQQHHQQQPVAQHSRATDSSSAGSEIVDNNKDIVKEPTPSEQDSSSEELSVSCLDIYERMTQSAPSNGNHSSQSQPLPQPYQTIPSSNSPSGGGGTTATSTDQTSSTTNIRGPSQIDQIEVVLNPQRAFRSTSAISLRDLQQPTIGSSAFSFMMTLLFVLVLWLVVFMVFGSRGHAIAGIFIALFFVGILINTCFFKFYFRLRLFLGMNAALAAAEQQARLQGANSSSLSSVKIEEPPPSYDSVDQSPPPYDLLQFYNKCSNSPVLHTCPYCEKPSPVFGLCNVCKTKIDKK